MNSRCLLGALAFLFMSFPALCAEGKGPVVKTIKVTDYGAKGDGKTDNTKVLHSIAARFPEADSLVIRIPKGTYLVRAEGTKKEQAGILIDRSRVALIMEDGAVISLVPNSAPRYNLLYVDNVEKVTISGGTLFGDREKHDYSEKGTHEFGFGIYLHGASNCVIRGITIKNVTGDGILVFGTNTSNVYLPCQNILIEDSVIDLVRRNGIGIGVGENVTIRNNTITNTGQPDAAGNAGAAPRTGIDIEGGCRPKHILVENNTITGSYSDAINSFNGNHVIIRGNKVDMPIQYQFSANILIEENQIDIKDKIINRSAIAMTSGAPGISKKGTMLATETRYEIISRKTLDFRTVGASSNVVGTMFICNKALALKEGDQVKHHMYNIIIRNNRIRGDCPGISSNAYSDDLCLIEGNDIEVSGAGIGANNAHVRNNKLKLNGSMGCVIRAENTTSLIEGNHIEGALRSVYIASKSVKSIFIKDNTFLNPVTQFATTSMVQGPDVDGIRLENNVIANYQSNVKVNALVSGIRNVSGNTIVNASGGGIQVPSIARVSGNVVRVSGSAFTGKSLSGKSLENGNTVKKYTK